MTGSTGAAAALRELRRRTRGAADGCFRMSTVGPFRKCAQARILKIVRRSV
jgi:hypothetical protein